MPSDFQTAITQLICKDPVVCLQQVESALIELEASKKTSNMTKVEDASASALKVTANYAGAGKGNGKSGKGNGKSSKGNGKSGKGHGKSGKGKSGKNSGPYAHADAGCWACGSWMRRRSACPIWNAGFSQNQNSNQDQYGKGGGKGGKGSW